jgi:Sulfotransferase family
VARPPSVRIDDLAAPRFLPAIADLFAAMGPVADELAITPEAMMTQASAETGLDAWGDGRFREPLALLCEALCGEAGLNAMGRVSAHAQLVQLLKNRLLVQDVLDHHPEILELPVERPIIIAGLPRTGTTHLHNLISADPALRSLPYWESLQPVLAAGELPRPGDPDPRLAATEVGLSMLDEAAPYFKRMHEMTTEHVHEEIQLLAMDFSTMFFETMAVLPSYRDWYLAADQTPAYEYLRTVLQVLQWTRGGTRWILKSPQNLEQFGAIRSVFPDATVVVTHRDPVAVTTSLVMMMTYVARLSIDHPDPEKIGRYWADRLAIMLSACERDRHLLDTGPVIDVLFDQFMADDIAMVKRIYGVAGQPFTLSTRAAMETFMADHPRGRHGGVQYDLAEFGLDGAERRAALRSYAERFGVVDEPAP